MGIVVPTVGRWFFVEVVAAAARTLREAGYDLLVFDGGDCRPGGLPVAGELRSKVDAVSWWPGGSGRGIWPLRDLGLPAVVVGGPVRRMPPVSGWTTRTAPPPRCATSCSWGTGTSR